jgi:integrase
MPAKSEQDIPFNDLAVRKIATTKHDKEMAYRIRGVDGLSLTCFPTGAAIYSVRFTIKGKRIKTSIGPYGTIPLARARDRAQEIMREAKLGENLPAKEEKEADRPTLRELWAKRLEKEDRRAASTMAQYGMMLELGIFPTLGNRKAEEVTDDDIADALEKIEDTRSPHAARLTKAALSSTYRWGQQQRHVRRNPCVGLGFSHQSKARKRVLTDGEMKALWSAVSGTPGLTNGMRNIIRLAILTGQRNSEVAGMECAELTGLDSATPRWDIPGSRMKRKSADQHVPLSTQAVEIVREASATTANGKHVFPGRPNGRRKGVWRQEHVSKDAVTRAMRKVMTAARLDDVRLHDMRRCVTTWLAENGHATEEVLDAILHHSRPGVTAKHYNFSLYEKQVRQALQTWGDHIWKITGQDAAAGTGKHGSNVVAMASGR